MVGRALEAGACSVDKLGPNEVTVIVLGSMATGTDVPSTIAEGKTVVVGVSVLLLLGEMAADVDLERAQLLSMTRWT